MNHARGRSKISKVSKAIGSIILLILLAGSARAEVILLKNGDKVSGTVVEETTDFITLETEAMGTISIKKDYLAPKEATKEKPAVEWAKKISLGYTQQGGNTRNSSFSGEVTVNRKTKKNEWTNRLTSYVKTTDKKMDAKKFYSMSRYAFSFGRDLKWYNFYKLEGEQDRFADIYYRLTPSVGVGYWFSDEEDYKLMVEGGVGYEYTKFRDGSTFSHVVLVPRGYFEKLLVGNLRFSEDITLYPSLDDLEKYRMHSETGLSQPINDAVSWKLKFVNDYDSIPAEGKKKSDYLFITSLEYSF